ncbi:hypothetical protein DUI87_22830 [Hirundo rustica rustica]|uniref:Tetraspanin n=1 Tax=Hirundo rustica rustica TaxID=333673 RepID=A0A3M0JHS2_HIRRU|nr:hypothetical protein DUI87_22830 [Hirundo rustica rustica]
MQGRHPHEKEVLHNQHDFVKFGLDWFNDKKLGGCGILGVGIWLAVTQGNFATLSSSFPSLSAANLLIVTGTFIMIIGFVGCIGAIKENKCLLLSVSIELLQCLVSRDAGAIAMHAAVTCISTEVTHWTQMRPESCAKQALIIAPRSCQVIPDHAVCGG